MHTEVTSSRSAAGRHQATLIVAVLALAGVLALLCVPSFARGAEEVEHVFDATLSLTGDCSESEIDPVPDPSCPTDPMPPRRFAKPSGVAVDAYGNRYVASAGTNFSGVAGRIDIFDSAGKYISGIDVVLPNYEASLAVDSEGNLYVAREIVGSGEESSQNLLRYEPTQYNPAAGEISYADPPKEIAPPPGSHWIAEYTTVAVDPENDRLYVSGGFLPGAASTGILELTSAAEGNTLVRAVLLEGVSDGGRWINSIAIDLDRNRIVVNDLDKSATSPGPRAKRVVKVFDLEAPADPAQPRELLFTIDGSTTPTEAFIAETRLLPVAVDEASGRIYVGDLDAPTRRVYEFDVDGSPLATIEGGIKATGMLLAQIAYDDSPASPTKDYLFVPSDSGPARSLAFGPPPEIGPPAVDGLAVTGVTSADAILRGKVNPEGLSTTYRIEYTTEEDFLVNGFAGAALAADGALSPSGEGLAVTAPLSGLSSGTTYRFRIVAKNELGEVERNAAFATYAAPEVTAGCPNQTLRTGPSGLLPDCRAYELVTPADTNNHEPLGTFPNNAFVSRQVSPAGDRLPFRVEGGALGGLEGTGSLNGDGYLASRTSSGWLTTYQGPSPAFSPSVVPGTSSPDGGFTFWATSGTDNPARLPGNDDTTYVRYPDGHSEPLGQGSLGVNSLASGRLITEGGSHIVFSTGGGREHPVQLEPDAAPSGTTAIYDRTADGILHVVSLKPGDMPFGANEDAAFAGASWDGRAISFAVKGTLYLRYDNAETYELGQGVDFAGVTEGGRRVFYVEAGNLKAFDVASQGTIAFSNTGDATPVTVASDGGSAYFVSEKALVGSGPNPAGDEPQAGSENLYLSREGQIRFVATVTERDVEGEVISSGRVDGLGLWVDALNPEGGLTGMLGLIPARVTPDGSVLLFKSRAPLTGYDSADHAQIFRFDADSNDLQCLSCMPTGAAAGSDATLQRFLPGRTGMMAWPENLRADGRRAFFESGDALVGIDRDGLNDVYQWEDQGVGTCSRPDGCLSLISSGQSGRDEHLWAVSRSGDDVFFITSDLLTAEDTDESPSIYDARVGGGFTPAAIPAGECLGEACQPAAVAPNDPTPASSTFQGAGNIAKKTARNRRSCPKGKKAIRRDGKRRCVPRHRKGSRKGQKRHQQAKDNGRVGR